MSPEDRATLLERISKYGDEIIGDVLFRPGPSCFEGNIFAPPYIVEGRIYSGIRAHCSVPNGDWVYFVSEHGESDCVRVQHLILLSPLEQLAREALAMEDA